MAYVTAGPNVTNEMLDGLYPYGVLVFMACVWTLVAVLGITGNAMVILSAILSKHVRTMTNVLVVNLSVADLWTCLSLPWTSVALLSNGDWPLASEVPCEVAALMWHTGLGASVYNLALIAFNRLVRITRPMSTYKWIFTPRTMAFMVAASWLIPVVIIVVPIVIGAGALGHDHKHHTCTDDDMHARADAYNLVQTIGFYPIPMATVVICYLLIYVHVRRHFKKQMYKKKNTSRTISTDRSGTSIAMIPSTSADASDEDDRRRQVISRQQLQITKNLFWSVSVFTVCISPYFISLFVPTSDTFDVYGATILIFNSCINPIIYAAKHPQFKMVLRPMLRCRWEEIPQPSRVLKAILVRRDQGPVTGLERQSSTWCREGPRTRTDYQLKETL